MQLSNPYVTHAIAAVAGFLVSPGGFVGYVKSALDRVVDVVAAWERFKVRLRQAERRPPPDPGLPPPPPARHRRPGKGDGDGPKG